MTKLTLEVGKTYICRDGREVTITKYDALRSPQYPFVSDLSAGIGCTFTYRADGAFYSSGRDDLDLISEKVSEELSGFETYARLKAYINEAVAQALRGITKPPEWERRNLAVIAEAKAQGKSLQYQVDGGDSWCTSFNPSPDRVNFTYRIEPDPVALYLGVAKSGPNSSWPVQIGAPSLSRLKVVSSHYSPDKVIVLTLDPDTLAVISCVSEAP